MSGIAKRIFLLLGSLVVCAAVLELGIRIYSIAFFPKMMIVDDVLGWKHAGDREKTFQNEFGEPVLVRQNERGHRGRLYPYSREGGGFRVLVLGDSFTEGSAVGEDELFTARLDSMIPDLEVINAGVGSYGTVQQYIYLLEEGLRYQPDLVVLMFYANDLSDNCLTYSPGIGPRPFAFRKEGRIEIERRLIGDDYARFTIPMPFRLTLANHSYLFYFLNSRVYQRVQEKRLAALHAADIEAAKRDCGRFEIFFEIVRRIDRELQSRQIGFLLVLIPTKGEMRSGVSVTQDRIVEFGERSGVAVAPLLARYHALFEREGEGLYFPVDIHWTAEGHRVAAEELARLLAERMPERLNGVRRNQTSSHRR